MTFKNFWKDLWLTMRHGKWEVVRERSPDSIMFGGSGGVNRYEYFATCHRTRDIILCSDKREAEAVVAYRNDNRGQKPVGWMG